MKIYEFFQAVADIAKTARKRFRASILAHLAANINAGKIGGAKQLFKIQPEEETKVRNPEILLKTFLIIKCVYYHK